MEASKTLKNRGLTRICNREKIENKIEENPKKYCVFYQEREGFGKAGAGYERLPFEDRWGCPLTINKETQIHFYIMDLSFFIGLIGI